MQGRRLEDDEQVGDVGCHLARWLQGRGLLRGGRQGAIGGCCQWLCSGLYFQPLVDRALLPLSVNLWPIPLGLPQAAGESSWVQEVWTSWCCSYVMMA